MRATFWIPFVLGFTLAADPAAAQAPQVLLYGDSLTTNYDGKPGYASRLIGMGWDAQNRARSGQQKATGVEKLENDLGLGLITGESEAAVLMWGSNDFEASPILNTDCIADALSFWRCHFEVVRSAFVAQVQAIEALGVDVIVAFPPPQYVAGVAEERNAALEFMRFLVQRDLEDLGIPLIDFYDEFLAMPNPQAIMDADGVHMNDFGALYLAIRVDETLRAQGLSPP